MRPIKITPDVISNADGSILYQSGKTEVICTATFESKTPEWLHNGGWITAEYSMLPASTSSRVAREISRGKKSPRSQEIQRLIGRSLRGSVDLNEIPGNSIYVDCDVINADGGTRTASITGGWIVLNLLIDSLLKNKTLKTNPITDQIAAISCGIYEGLELLDLDYYEDSNTETDANFIISKSKNLIEVQATAEKGNFSKKQLNTLIDLASEECDKLFNIQSEALNNDK